MTYYDVYTESLLSIIRVADNLEQSHQSMYCVQHAIMLYVTLINIDGIVHRELRRILLTGVPLPQFTRLRSACE